MTSLDPIFTPVGAALAIALVLAASYILACLRLRGPEDTVLLANIRVVTWLYVHVMHRLKSNPASRDPLPRDGPVIVVANHRSYLDPFFVAVLTRRPIHFLMAREYYELPVLGWIFRGLRCIPVNRDGNDLGATKRALGFLKAGKVIGIFPQGGIRDPDDLGEGKSGVALLALKTGAPIVPFYVAGSPAHDSLLRAVLSCSRTRVYCGRPFKLERHGEGKPGRGELAALATRVLEAIAAQNPRSRAVDHTDEGIEKLSRNHLAG